MCSTAAQPSRADIKQSRNRLVSDHLENWSIPPSSAPEVVGFYRELNGLDPESKDENRNQNSTHNAPVSTGRDNDIYDMIMLGSPRKRDVIRHTWNQRKQTNNEYVQTRIVDIAEALDMDPGSVAKIIKDLETVAYMRVEKIFNAGKSVVDLPPIHRHLGDLFDNPLEQTSITRAARAMMIDISKDHFNEDGYLNNGKELLFSPEFHSIAPGTDLQPFVKEDGRGTFEIGAQATEIEESEKWEAIEGVCRSVGYILANLALFNAEEEADCEVIEMTPRTCPCEGICIHFLVLL